MYAKYICLDINYNRININKYVFLDIKCSIDTCLVKNNLWEILLWLDNGHARIIRSSIRISLFGKTSAIGNEYLVIFNEQPGIMHTLSLQTQTLPVYIIFAYNSVVLRNYITQKTT